MKLASSFTMEINSFVSRCDELDKIPVKIFCSHCRDFKWITADPHPYKNMASNKFPVSVCLDCKEDIERQLQEYFDRDQDMFR